MSTGKGKMLLVFCDGTGQDGNICSDGTGQDDTPRQEACESRSMFFVSVLNKRIFLATTGNGDAKPPYATNVLRLCTLFWPVLDVTVLTSWLSTQLVVCSLERRKLCLS